MQCPIPPSILQGSFSARWRALHEDSVQNEYTLLLREGSFHVYSFIGDNEEADEVSFIYLFASHGLSITRFQASGTPSRSLATLESSTSEDRDNLQELSNRILSHADKGRIESSGSASSISTTAPTLQKQVNAGLA